MDFGSLAFFFCASLLLTAYSTQALNSGSSLCLKRTLTDITALEGDLCYPHFLEENFTPKVLQVGGHDLKDVLSNNKKGRHGLSAVLFYVNWCPFSRRMRDLFDALSVLFPDVNHIAVESSALWPSELSEYGVRSFPALFVQNNTLRFQFYGARSIEAIAEFYVDKTGCMPFALSYSLDDRNYSPRRHANKERRWWKLFVSRLWDDFYLTFSVLFLLLGSFFYVQPQLAAVLRKLWNLKDTSSKAQKEPPRGVNARPRKRVADGTGKGKGSQHRKEDRESGKGVLSVPSWPSSSLAAVALAECSSRNVATEDLAKKSASGN